MCRAPRIGYDNVAFFQNGIRIIATVVAYDDAGRLIVSNDFFDNVWHVAVDDVEIVDEPENEPPSE